MTFAAERETTRPHRFNPLRTRGTAMRPNVLLLAKLITLAFVVSGQFSLLPNHFVPFLDAFRHAGSPDAFHRVLQAVFAAAAVALFLNIAVRVACITLGLVVMAGLASSMAYFENNRTFAALVLVLAGLQDPDSEPWLLQWQMVILYLSAAANKWLLADWRAGRFFDAWFGQLHPGIWNRVSGLLPDRATARIVSVAAMVTETALGVGFAVRRLFPVAVWLGLVFHASLTLLANRTFGMFWFAASATYLAFIDWPDELVVRAGEGGRWDRSLAVARQLDLEHVCRWETGPARSVELRHAGRVYDGWGAVLRIFLYNPVTLFVAVVLAAAPRSQPRVPALLELVVLMAFAVDTLRRRLRRRGTSARRA